MIEYEFQTYSSAVVKNVYCDMCGEVLTSETMPHMDRWKPALEFTHSDESSIIVGNLCWPCMKKIGDFLKAEGTTIFRTTRDWNLKNLAAEEEAKARYKETGVHILNRNESP